MPLFTDLFTLEFVQRALIVLLATVSWVAHVRTRTRTAQESFA